MEFGDILRELLEEHEMTQKQLANALCLSVSTVGNYTNNQREPDYAILRQIADYFHVSIDYLLDYAPNGEKITHAEQRLLRCYHGMSDAAQNALLDQAAALAKHFPSE